MTVDRPPVRRQDYRPPSYLVERVRLDFQLDAAETLVRARLDLRRNPEGHGPLRLDGEGLELRAINLDDQALEPGAYRLDEHGLTLDGRPARCRLDTEVAVRPARNTSLLGLYQAGNLLCTQCEPEAFRRITFFPDRPDVLAPFRVSLTADPARYPVLLANGNPRGTRRLADGRMQAVWDDPHPKPSYLFALVAGDLHAAERRFTTASGRQVAVRLWVAPENRRRCAHALDAIVGAMAWDEARYGREYDLEVFNAVAVSQYTMGAMENKGLNVFNDRYALADAVTASDRDHRDIEAMVAHEYLHNWSGNRVTCRDWFQLSLKEGFTVLREQQFVADRGWAAVRRIEDARLMRTRQFAEDAGPLSHAVRPDQYKEIENFYTDTVYSKGAELLRMLETLVGRECFRRACDLYFRRHDGQAVTVEALVTCVAETSGRDLSAFMAWYDRPGTPQLEVRGRYHGPRRRYELRVRQHPPPGADPDEPPLPMPLAMGLLEPGGGELPLRLAGEPPEAARRGRVLELSQREHRFLFEDVPAPPVPALLRGFSAPVRLQVRLPDQALEVLALHEPDAVARWDAVQRLVGRALRARLAGRRPALSERRLETVFRHLLDSDTADAGLAAELLTLPPEAALADLLGTPEVEAVSRAREGLRRRLGRALAGPLEGAFRRCRTSAPYAPSVEQITRRSLGNACLGYLARPDHPAGLALALEQYRGAGSLNDALAALELLADSEHPEGETALADFRRRHRQRPRVLDKWLAVQARARRADSPERVRALMAEPLFSLEEPNRVRSLVEVFAAENPLGFHRRDGAGYRLLADCVLALDPVNPSLAAALLRHLSGWRRWGPVRGERMRAALSGLAAVAGLSGGVREVLEGSLGTGAD